MMVEYGEEFWGSGWKPLYGFLGGNPLAAMPSLHFATSVTAAHLLAETGPRRRGASGWAYAGTLGVALVYLGEHYVVDLAAGLALAEGVRRGAPAAARPPVRACRAPCRRWRRARAHDASPRLRCSRRPAEPREERRRAPGAAAHAAQPASRWPASCSPRSRRSTSCCRSSPASTTRGTGSRTAGPRGSIAALAVHVRHVRRLRRDVPRRLRARRLADRLERQLPDHDGRAGRLAPVRGGRRRRPRADRVGAAPLGHAQAHRGRQDDRLPRADLPALRRSR